MRNTKTPVILILAILFCLTAALSFAATIELRETGQTTTFVAGDDASQMRGVAWPSPRFVNNGDGTLTDKLTGLIWLKNANCTETVGGVAKGSSTLSWFGALAWSNSLANGYCNLTDGSTAGQWRLPTIRELQSLVNAGQASTSWLNGQGFSNVLGSYYWSSTTDAADTNYACKKE